MADLAREWEEAEPLQADWDAAAPVAEFAPKEEPGVGDSLLSGIYRGAWSIPGLVGIDNAKAQAAFEYAKRKIRGEPADFAALEGEQRGIERSAETAHPVATGLGIGVGAAPWVAVAPQAAPASASLGSRALGSALTAGAQSAAVEGGVTADLPVEERLGRMLLAGVTGMGAGALAPGAGSMMSQRAIDDAAGVPRVPGKVRSWLDKKAEEEAFKAAAAGNAKSEMRRVNRDSPNRAREVGRFLLDEKLIGSNTAQPDDIFRAASALASREGDRMTDLAAQASRVSEKVPSAAVDLAETIRGPGRAAIRELSEDPFQPAAAEQVAGHIRRLANKYANREELIADLQKIVAESGLEDDEAALFLDDLTFAARTYLPGMDDVGRKLAKAGRTAAQDAELSGPESKLLQAYLASVAEKYQSARITPSEAWTIRQQLDTLIRGNSKSLDPDRNVASGAMNEFRRDLSSRIGTAMDEARVGPEWRDANRRYGLAAEARDVAEVGRAAEGTRRVGLSETGGATTGGVVGAIVGGPVVSPLGAAAGALAGHALRRYGSATAARSMDRLSKALARDPQAFGAKGPALAKIHAERGPEALAAAHYVLSHTNPEYRARAAQVMDTSDDQRLAEATP